MVAFKSVIVFFKVPSDLHCDVFHVACVWPLRILQAMMLLFRIEMRSGGGERRSLALGILMNVNRMIAGGQILQMQIDLNSRGSGSRG